MPEGLWLHMVTGNQNRREHQNCEERGTAWETSRGSLKRRWGGEFHHWHSKLFSGWFGGFLLLVTEKVALKERNFERIFNCSYITGVGWNPLNPFSPSRWKLGIHEKHCQKTWVQNGSRLCADWYLFGLFFSLLLNLDMILKRKNQTVTIQLFDLFFQSMIIFLFQVSIYLKRDI